MLQKDFQSYDNQYNTTNNPRRLFIFRTKHIADLYAQDGENKGGQTDDEHRRPQIHLDAGKRNTYRQGIDAGGDGQKEHGL